MSGGELTIGGGKDYSAKAQRPALQRTDGTVNPLPIGTVLNGGIRIDKKHAGADGHPVNYCLAELFPVDAAFEADGEVINAYVDTDGDVLSSCYDNLTVAAHTHSYKSHTGALSGSLHKCPCGVTEAHTWSNGVCTVCNYVCQHTNVDADSYICAAYICAAYKAQMTASLTADETITYIDGCGLQALI